MIPKILPTPIPSSPHPAIDKSWDRHVAIDPTLRPAFTAYGAAQKNVEALFAKDTLCVTTGQQAGLFTGPLLTIYKALAAVAVAKQCQEALGRHVVPVFWVPGDDHDFAECDHHVVQDKASELHRVTLRQRDHNAPNTPMYRELLGADVDAALADLQDALPATEFSPLILDWLRRHYQPSASLAQAFRHALAELLGEFGLVVFDPTHDAAKKLASPYIHRALEHAEAIGRGLAERAAALKQGNQPVPIEVREHETMVMVEASEGRDRLVLDHGAFVTRRSSERWSLQDLATQLHENPLKFSAGVLLRPVVEAALLPTVAYVAGPSERAYLAQALPIYETLNISPQQVITRWSGVVLEGRVEKTLSKYDLQVEDLRAPDGQLEGRLARDDMPEELSKSLAVIRATLNEHIPAIVTAAESIDPTLKKPAESLKGSLHKTLGDIEKRIVSRLKQQNDTLIRQIAVARTSLVPERQPQERVYGVVTFLNKYGQEFLHGIADSCETWVNGWGAQRE